MKQIGMKTTDWCVCVHTKIYVYSMRVVYDDEEGKSFSIFIAPLTLYSLILWQYASRTLPLSLVIHFSSFMTFIIIPFSITYRLSALVSKEKFLRVFSSLLTINWWRVRRIKMIIFLFCGRRLITLIDNLIRIMKFMNK